MRTLASFRLFRHEGLSAHAVSTQLGIAPTISAELGDPISPGSPRRRDTSLWLLRSAPNVEEGVELSEQLQRLLDELLPAHGALRNLVEQGYHANWSCLVAANPAEHAVELDRPLLTSLLRLPGDLWIDACGD
jgi:hypothetical protein